MWTHNIGIQMKRKEVTKTFLKGDFKLKKTLVPMVVSVARVSIGVWLNVSARLLHRLNRLHRHNKLLVLVFHLFARIVFQPSVKYTPHGNPQVGVHKTGLLAHNIHSFCEIRRVGGQLHLLMV